VVSIYESQVEAISIDIYCYSQSHQDKTSSFNITTMPEVYAAPQDYAFPRNFKGYGEKGLEGLKWPNNAKIAVSFVINYEEVGDCPLLLP
jgi:hypothetical protein